VRRSSSAAATRCRGGSWTPPPSSAACSPTRSATATRCSRSGSRSCSRTRTSTPGTSGRRRSSSPPSSTTPARVYWSQSRLYSSKGDAELAAHFARLTIGTLDHTEHTALAARALLLLAHIENDRGNHERVLALVDEGLPALHATGAAVEETMLLLERARALAALDEPEEAAAIALRVTARLGNARPSSAARAYATAAQVFRRIGEPHRALELYELAAELLTADDRHAAEVWTAIGELHEEAGRADQALAAFKRALSAQPASAVRR
jgi:tetratricopeptide (TPR) repeat protein